MDFLQHLTVQCEAALGSLPADVRADAYVVSFFVYDEEADPWRPTVTVDVNTESRVQFAINAPDEDRLNKWWVPTSPEEARWNFAFWRQEPLAVLGDSRADSVGSDLRGQWLRESGLWIDEPNDQDWKDQRVTASFVDLLVAVAGSLHASGLICELFGERTAVLIHELEYYDEIADQCERANPGGQAAAFAAWVRNPV